MYYMSSYMSHEPCTLLDNMIIIILCNRLLLSTSLAKICIYQILNSHQITYNSHKLYTNFDTVNVAMVTYRYSYVRLDGSMGIKKRQKIVDRFNDPTVSRVCSAYKVTLTR